MTKDHKILSIQLPISELAAIDVEAQAAPFFGNRSEYARSIILGRDQMRIEAAPQARQLIDHYQQQLDQQAQAHQSRYDQLLTEKQQRISQLIDRVNALEQALFDREDQMQEQQQALIQLEETNQTLCVDSEINRMKYELVTNQLDEERARARQDEQRWQEERRQLNAQLKESQSGQQQLRDTTRVIDSVTNFFTSNPDLGKELGSLFAPKPREQPKAEPSADARLGAAIRYDFPGAQLGPVLDLLRYLHDTPTEKATLLAQPAFVSYQARIRSNQQPTSDTGKKE